eukprot:163815_1
MNFYRSEHLKGFNSTKCNDDPFAFMNIVNGNDKSKLTKKKIVWGGTDGASCMKLLVKEMIRHWNSIMQYIHCIAHRGALGGKDVDKYNENDSKNKELKEIKKTLNQLNIEMNAVPCFIKNSPKLRDSLY